MPKELAVRVNNRHYAVEAEKLAKAFQGRPLDEQDQPAKVLVWVPSGQLVQLKVKLSKKKKKLKVAPHVIVWSAELICKDEALQKGYVIAETL